MLRSKMHYYTMLINNQVMKSISSINEKIEAVNKIWIGKFLIVDLKVYEVIDVRLEGLNDKIDLALEDSNVEIIFILKSEEETIELNVFKELNENVRNIAGEYKYKEEAQQVLDTYGKRFC